MYEHWFEQKEWICPSNLNTNKQSRDFTTDLEEDYVEKNDFMLELIWKKRAFSFHKHLCFLCCVPKNGERKHQKMLSFSIQCLQLLVIVIRKKAPVRLCILHISYFWQRIYFYFALWWWWCSYSISGHLLDAAKKKLSISVSLYSSVVKNDEWKIIKNEMKQSFFWK